MSYEPIYVSFGRPGAAAVEAGAADFRRVLLDHDSVLSPGTPIWTVEHARELLSDFNGRPDISAASFFDKLKLQLETTSGGAVQLFAELLYLDVLPLSDYRGATKRTLIERTLALADRTLELPDLVEKALDQGVLNGGVAFKTRRPFQLQYLVEFAVGFLDLPDAERQRLLEDPLGFRDALNAMTTVNAPSQKYALLYLMFPRYYLPIANGEHRARIRSAFASELSRPLGDADQDLHDIFLALTAQASGAVNLYQAPYREQWDPKALSSSTYQQSPWDKFMSWAGRIAASVDLSQLERDYKLVMADRLDVARDAVLSDVPDWVTTLKSALNSTNLLSSFYKVELFKTMTAQPDAVRDALVRFWSAEPDPLLLTTFHTELRAITAVTPGNATSLGSVLLMARDSSQFPPYRPSPVDKARALTATPSSGTTASERYDVLLSMCDEVLERSPEVGVELLDRLDAQSLIWAVVNYDPPESWTASDRSSFLTWRGDVAESDPVSTPHAWLVRGGGPGDDPVPAWLAGGHVSLPATSLRDVDAGVTREELKTIVDDDYGHATYGDRSDLVDAFYEFLTRMDLGHVVVVISEGRAHVGHVNGPALRRTTGGEGSVLVREVSWDSPHSVPIEHLPTAVQAKAKTRHAVVDVTESLDALEALIAGAPAAQDAETVTLPRPTAHLAEALHVPFEWLDDVVDLLADRRQLIFYGPPGTGKTYLARAVAAHLAGNGVRLVQFHPAYAYEDFFEGYRPTESGGFKLKPGPLRSMADEASRHPGTPFVLIIDEINRGNLAKIFGELYFLLEYRTEVIRLTYSDDDFTLPPNLFVIGTMNTADRSIALVDSAMRRRFAFLPLHPSEPPTDGVLRRWLQANSRTGEVADLLDALNAAIDDEDFKIGPSYVMRSSVFESGGLERVWRTSILPLLEEYHYGQLTRAEVHADYSLDAVRARVKPAASLDLSAAPVVPVPAEVHSDGPAPSAD